MKILIIAQYYAPETVGAGIWIRELAEGLVAKGHQVTMLTAFPHYPKRVIFDEYRGKKFMRETINGVDIIRTYIYANPSESKKSRLMNWGSFSFSAFLGGLFTKIKPDVIYTISPPLPLAYSGILLGRSKHCPVVTNIQDIYPLIAIELGILKNPRIIRFFENMERFVYRNSKALVGISEGFRQHFANKGYPLDQSYIVTNWADPDFFISGPKDNPFRQSLKSGDNFVVLYCGGLTYNSNLEPLIDAAKVLENEPFQFVIAGEGAQKEALMERAKKLELKNIQFHPFQPLDKYGETMQAGDITVVALNRAAALASVPGKTFRQMSAGRAILAITTLGNELDRMIQDGKCGVSVPTDNPGEIVKALRWAIEHRAEVDEMGVNAREYLKLYHDRERCVSQVEKILLHAVDPQKYSQPQRGL